jgi:hypothetical protein
MLSTTSPIDLKLPPDFLAQVGGLLVASSTYSPFTLHQRAVALSQELVNLNARDPVMPDYSRPLQPYLVALRMVRRPSADIEEYQVFTTLVPAVSEEQARRSAADLGYAIGNASEWQWKFTGNDNDVTVTLAHTVDLHQTAESAAVGP